VRFLLGRLGEGALTIIFVSVVVFLLLAAAPGDPVELMLSGQNASPEVIEQLRQEMGLDQPLYLQYLDFVGNALRGDLGRSWTTGDVVLSELLRVLPATLQLGIGALLVSTTVGITVGLISAFKQYSWIDFLARTIVIAAVSIPIFWLGLMLIVVFSVTLRWFPTSGTGTWQHLVLPVLALSTYYTAIAVRITRSSMLEVLKQDYISAARAKGLRERTILFRHALGNALIPIVTVLGLQLGYLLGGAILTEIVFAYSGMGWMTVNALFARDYPVVRGGVLLMATGFILVNILVDCLYTVLDPRIRLGA
jgi:peptide/nickel transport system permease protein